MAITLEEVAYIIGGNLRVEQISPESMYFHATLLDPINDPVMVRVSPSKEPNRRFDNVEARGKAVTPELAKQELVDLIRGRIISYEVPVMWTSSTEHLAVPPTLEVGETKKIPRLRLLDEGEKKAKPGKFRATTMIDSEIYQIGEDVDSAEEARDLCVLVDCGSGIGLFWVFNDQGQGVEFA